jgi:hypothetical protein
MKDSGRLKKLTGFVYNTSSVHDKMVLLMYFWEEAS